MDDIQLPGHGLVPRPLLAKTDPRLFTYGISAYDWSTAPADDAVQGPNQFGIPDKNQDGGGSCTCQSCRNGVYHAIGVDISVEDTYSHVHLPGPDGGAYLDAPEAFVSLKGYLPASKYPDPNPESETAMQKTIQVQDGDRIRTFQLYTKPIYPISIDACAQALQNHTYIKLGIAGSWKKGWNSSWTDPKYQGQNDWQHAIAIFKESIVIRNGKKAIKAKSSWCGSKDYLGQPNYCHFINEDYFNAGGVFEILAVDIKEIIMPGQNETIYTINFNGKAGLLFQGGYGANILYANNESHYQELGDAYGKNTCHPDPANPGKWIFSPFDITINVPAPQAPAASI